MGFSSHIIQQVGENLELSFLLKDGGLDKFKNKGCFVFLIQNDSLFLDISSYLSSQRLSNHKYIILQELGKKIEATIQEKPLQSIWIHKSNEGSQIFKILNPNPNIRSYFQEYTTYLRSVLEERNRYLPIFL